MPATFPTSKDFCTHIRVESRAGKTQAQLKIKYATLDTHGCWLCRFKEGDGAFHAANECKLLTTFYPYPSILNIIPSVPISPSQHQPISGRWTHFGFGSSYTNRKQELSPLQFSKHHSYLSDVAFLWPMWSYKLHQKIAGTICWFTLCNQCKRLPLWSKHKMHLWWNWHPEDHGIYATLWYSWSWTKFNIKWILVSDNCSR